MLKRKQIYWICTLPRISSIISYYRWKLTLLNNYTIEQTNGTYEIPLQIKPKEVKSV